MLKAIITTIAILLGGAAALAQGIATPQMSEAECASIWRKAGASSLFDTLTQAQVQPYVSDFSRVDTDSDQKVSGAEFMIACQHGMVRDAGGSGSGPSKKN